MIRCLAVGALDRVAAFDWKAKARFCVLVTDAPCHGSAHHDPGVSDDHPGAHPAGLTVPGVMKAIRAKNIDLLPVYLRDDLTKKTDTAFRSAYNSTGEVSCSMCLWNSSSYFVCVYRWVPKFSSYGSV